MMEYAELRVRELTEDSDVFVKAYSALADRPELIRNLMYSYYRLGNIRNQVNHAENVKGIQDDGEIDYNASNEIFDLLVAAINMFINNYEKALAACEAIKAFALSGMQFAMCNFNKK